MGIFEDIKDMQDKYGYDWSQVFDANKVKDNTVPTKKPTDKAVMDAAKLIAKKNILTKKPSVSLNNPDPAMIASNSNKGMYEGIKNSKDPAVRKAYDAVLTGDKAGAVADTGVGLDDLKKYYLASILQQPSYTAPTNLGDIFKGVWNAGSKGDWGGAALSGIGGLAQYMNTGEGKQILAGMQSDPYLGAAYLDQANTEKGTESALRQAYAEAGKERTKNIGDYIRGEETSGIEQDKIKADIMKAELSAKIADEKDNNKKPTDNEIADEINKYDIDPNDRQYYIDERKAGRLPVVKGKPWWGKLLGLFGGSGKTDVEKEPNAAPPAREGLATK